MLTGPEMEHLPLPRDPIADHPDVPLATRQHHDNAPFLEYPERHAGVLQARYPHVPSQADALRGTGPPGAAAISSYQVLDYLQGYLFYSLLGEFLGWADVDDDDEGGGGDGGESEGRFHPNAYITVRYDEQGELNYMGLSTRRLHHDLKALRAEGWLADVRRGDEKYRHFSECLATAASTLAGVNDRFPGLVEVFADEMVCLASVGETLDAALQTALTQGSVKGESVSHVTTSSKGTHQGSLTRCSITEMVPGKLQVHEGAKYNWLSAIEPLLDPTAAATKASMVAAGWCPGDIGKVCESFHSVAAMYYFTNFKADPDPAAAGLHRDCRDYGCDLRIPAEPRHMDPSGDCGCPGTLSFEEEDLVEIYEKGEIPCFSVGKLDGSLVVALSSCALDEEARRDPANHYVALSHVWSEGMGNPAGNALPFCQVGYVQYWARMAYQLVEEKIRDDAESGVVEEDLGGGLKMLTEGRRDVQVNLWIDTLCCPATPGRGKDLCLSRMRAIYSNASAVLVKSSVLSAESVADVARDTEKGVMDVAARVYLSPWMRRMWTLQEGVLAGASHEVSGAGGRLCFSFRDGLLTLDSLVGLLKRAPAREARLAWQLMGKFGDLSPRMWRLAEEEGEEEKEGRARDLFLSMLVHSLKYRGLTVAADEAICLATLLDLRLNASRAGPVAPLVEDGGMEVRPDNAMCELWRRVEEILNKGGASLPSDIIFSQVPRVRAAGFRWAPRTLAQYARQGHLYVSHSSAHPTRIAEDGFRVRLPGARLVCAGDPEAAARVARLLGPVRESADNDGGETEGDGRAVSVGRVIIARMGERWYAVRVRGEGAETDASPRSESDGRPEGASGDAQRGGDLARVIGSGSVDLIFRRDEEVRGPGLLVSAAARDSSSLPSPPPSSDLGSALEGLSLETTGPRRVRSELPASIMPVAGPSCVIFAAAQRFIDDSRRAAGAETRQSSVAVSGAEEKEIAEDQKKARDLLVATAEGLVGSSEELKEALYLNVLARKSSSTDGDALNMFLDFVRQVARSGGIWKGERYPDDQEWCVD